MTGGARNLIAGNLKSGVSIVNSSDSNVVAGNYVGLDSTGTIARGNRLNGVYITTSGNDVIGNLVSGNLNSGVVLSTNSATNNLIAGNLIGTDATGGDGDLKRDPGPRCRQRRCSDRVPPGWRLHQRRRDRQHGGGTTAGSRNVISGNASNGIQILGISINANPVPPGNVVLGNYIGTDASGTFSDGNAAGGVFVYNARDNIVGVPGTGGGNLISGNLGSGVAIQGESATGNLILANLIGTKHDRYRPDRQQRQRRDRGRGDERPGRRPRCGRRQRDPGQWRDRGLGLVERELDVCGG